jgi:threonine dehydrogenase-like Zn-dependent dehydrogenase
MQALWLEEKVLQVREVPEPQKTGEALIRIRVTGICSTDLELVKGYYPFTGVLGHEFVGEVTQCEDAAWVGQRVVGEINVTCGGCESCLHGRPTHCENRSVLGISNRDGVFAEYTTLPVANLHRIPEEVPDEMAVFTEPLPSRSWSRSTSSPTSASCWSVRAAWGN